MVHFILILRSGMKEEKQQMGNWTVMRPPEWPVEIIETDSCRLLAVIFIILVFLPWILLRLKQEQRI